MDKLKNEQRKGCLKRSVSSFEFNSESSISNVKETKSFTGALHELKTANNIDDGPRDKLSANKNKDQEKFLKSGYITKEISSEKIFVVKHEMLNYRGRQYSLSDIATRWKKDCRMWLWKNKQNKSMTELIEKTQCLQIQSRKP